MNQIEIVNLALSHLGAAPIQDFEEGSAEANAAALNYDAARRSALRAYPWSFALKVETLARLDREGGDFEFVYALPGDCVRPVRLLRGGMFGGGSSGGPGFAVRGRELLAHWNPARLEYVADIKDPTLFDDAFVEAFAYTLASKLALSVTGDADKMQMYLQLSRTLVREAAATSAREQRADGGLDAYLRARR